jgi:hypothetical protein
MSALSLRFTRWSQKFAGLATLLSDKNNEREEEKITMRSFFDDQAETRGRQMP